MSAESWPPSLKEWVAKCLGQMSDSNRQEAQAELRQVIADAFEKSTLWTTDWAGVQLQRCECVTLPEFCRGISSVYSLLPKPPPVLNLKRKSADGQITNSKKSKKANKAFANSYPNEYNYSDQLALNRRAERFQREHELERSRMSSNNNPKNNHYYSQHYSASVNPYRTRDEPEGDPNVMDWDRYTIVGTSQEIFKDYLRLTSEPKPETIRPYAVLQQTLTELKKRWREKVSYSWICNQLKSLRQDLTVQRIKNDFTVQVYEIHARMALESNDMVEYNQCQATLRILYELGIPGKVEEFTAYRILMLLHGRNRSELNLYVGQLTPQQKASPAVGHALGVQRALATGNYHSLFKLYLTAPNMGAYIMDHFIDRERARALLVITKSYMKIPLAFVQDELAFEELEEARTFLSTHGAAVFVDPKHPDSQKVLDCRQAHPKLQQVFDDKYRKVMIKGAI
ncbi:hypothetical protein FA15DRAFT_590095 [Coprinopsis marcescibilis]|uniref:PCI domain-containing protein n=1 Tax=Coprinopsis marcescibilis TaxID=230819 RepID=A0A5C3LBC4_COPMA|nr:hypothetical protein FA15DRAFT_590095 [Coprinopsis marcescibilis]